MLERNFNYRRLATPENEIKGVCQNAYALIMQENYAAASDLFIEIKRQSKTYQENVKEKNALNFFNFSNLLEQFYVFLNTYYVQDCKEAKNPKIRYSHKIVYDARITEIYRKMSIIFKHMLAWRQLSAKLGHEQAEFKMAEFYENKLNDEQKKYMKFGLPSSAVFRLNRHQLNGLLIGLTRKQVTHFNFNPYINDAVEAGFDFNRLIELNSKQCQILLKEKNFTSYIEVIVSPSFGWAQKLNRLIVPNMLKFHVGISELVWRAVKKNIVKVLDQATNEGSIFGYKYRLAQGVDQDNFSENWQSALEKYRELKKILTVHATEKAGWLKLSTEEIKVISPYLQNFNDSRASIVDVECAIREAYENLKLEIRYSNNPITIYLPNTNFHDGIIRVCRNIEKVLARVAPIDLATLSLEDIPIYPHISIRKETDYSPDFPEDSKQFDPFSSPACLALERESLLFRNLWADARSLNPKLDLQHSSINLVTGLSIL